MVLHENNCVIKTNHILSFIKSIIEVERKIKEKDNIKLDVLIISTYYRSLKSNLISIYPDEHLSTNDNCNIKFHSILKDTNPDIIIFDQYHTVPNYRFDMKRKDGSPMTKCYHFNNSEMDCTFDLSNIKDKFKNDLRTDKLKRVLKNN